MAAETAAHEARRATNWAIGATLLSAATVIGLIITIAQTFGALSAARRGNEITLGAQRAWMTLDVEPKLSMRDIESGLYFRAELVVQNVGQTTANFFGVKAALLFQHKGESDDDFRARMARQVSHWVAANQIPKAYTLPPTGRERGPYWIEANPPELVTEEILGGVLICRPILLLAAFYRTVMEPGLQQIQWRAWRINSVEADGRDVSFLRLDQEFLEDRLKASPMIGMNHEEQPAAQRDPDQDNRD